ncbi:unnamed protein product [Allacma fusca]|uniref:FAM234A/B beta-propeller domain-containing protein n=1 Tax=Allacma fusca TaxID=39272 RepID=A0A8J2KVM7_9HEXA|nr:unnamed protein product [Allacma fusca]
MNETKLEINENYEEADLSDVDDDVFVRSGGRNGYRLEYDTAKKPLMTPRKKQYNFDGIKNGGFHTEVRSSPPVLRVICVPMCYIMIATLAMLGIIALVIFLMGHISWPLGVSKLWANSKVLEKLLPCDNIVVEDVWVKHFPKFLTESSFRSLDINQDGTDDIIFGYATGADGLDVPEFVCDIYFPGQNPCYGGVLALNGKDGSELWRHWTAHEVFAINCNEDLNKDGMPDCLVAGRAGVFCALNSKDGKIIWTFGDNVARNPMMNIYTPQFIRDLDGDGIVDVVAIHGGDPLAEIDSPTRLPGRIVLLSGKDGSVLQWVTTPDQRESYYSPQVLTHGQDGSDYLLFGTGGETHGGGLYVILMTDLYKGLIDKAQAIYKDEFKGVMVPPVITDVNGDGVDDIVMAMFNSTVVAFDGTNFQQIWNTTFPSSETYTTPTPGYFTGDDIPDFLVKYQTGPGFPVYYHAQTTLLDGKTGKPILGEPIIDSIGSQASTPIIRMEGLGNDLFLYWSSNCEGFEGNSSEYKFVKGTNIHEQSRSDFCKLRFDSKLINQLRAFNRKIGIPGTIIYDSELRASDEYNMTVNTSQEGKAYLDAHPEMWKYFGEQSDPKNQQLNKDSVYLPNSGFDQMEPPMNAFPGMSSQMQVGGLNGLGNLPQQPLPDLPYLPFPGQGVYDLSSQPELTEDVKYPVYHSVRKHGFQGAPNVNPNSNMNINVDRRGYESRPANPVYGNYFDGSNNLNSKYSGMGGSPSLSFENLGFGSQNQIPSNNGYGNQGTYYQWQNPGSSGNTDSTKGSRRHHRVKRHVGPHDNDGIQRLISTGTLAAPLQENSGGIDLIFATYWFFPAKTQIISKNRDCLQEKTEERRAKNTKKYETLSDDPFDDVIRRECFGEDVETNDDDGKIYESQASYNPFDIHMGQMSVYRLHISCNCTNQKTPRGPHERCAKILPLKNQPWAGYMGSHADSYFPKVNIGQELLRFVTPA